MDQMFQLNTENLNVSKEINICYTCGDDIIQAESHLHQWIFAQNSHHTQDIDDTDEPYISNFIPENPGMERRNSIHQLGVNTKNNLTKSLLPEKI